MKSKNLIPVQGVYSLDGWTQWNPLLSAENRPADISSAESNRRKGASIKDVPSKSGLFDPLVPPITSLLLQ